MEASKLKIRKKKFLSAFPENQIEHGEEYSKKLRKNYNKELISSKRLRLSQYSSEKSFKDIKEAAKEIENGSIHAIRYIRERTIDCNKLATEEIISLNLLPRIIELLKSENEEIVLEAAWILANMIENKSTEQIYLNNGHLELLEIIPKVPEKLQEICIWALGNMAGHSILFRDRLLDLGIMKKIFNILSKEKLELELLRAICWTVNNLCCGKPAVSIKIMTPYIEIICNSLIELEDCEVLKYSILTLLYAAKCSCDAILSILPKLMKLSLHNEFREVILKIFYKISLKGSTQIAALVDAGIIGIVEEIIATDKNNSNLRNSCMVIINIISESNSSYMSIILSNGIPTNICKAIEYKEIDSLATVSLAYTLLGLCEDATEYQMDTIVNIGALNSFMSIIDRSNVEFTMVALSGIKEILEVGEIRDRKSVV